MKQSHLKQAAIKHPIIAGLSVVLIFEILMLIFSLGTVLFAPTFLTQNGDFVLQGTVEAFLSLAAIGVVAMFGYNKIWEEKGRGIEEGFGAGTYFIVMYAVSLASALVEGITMNYEWEVPWKILVFTVCVFLIGFCEESFYRGVVANIFYDRYATDPAGVWSATVGSGMVFGLMHLTNMLGATDVGYIQGVIVQVVCACAMGMALSAVYFRCRNIWAMVLLHGFIDFCGAFSAGAFTGGSLTETIGSYDPAMCISAIPYLILTAVLLRPKKMRAMLEYRRMRDGVPYTDEDIMQSSKKNKRSRTVIIVVSALILIILVSLATGLYGDATVLDYSDTKEIAAYESAIHQIDGIAVDESGEYVITVLSLPENSNAYATFTLLDGNTKVYDITIGGRDSYASYIHLETGHSYSLIIEYDYSCVAESLSKHTVSVTIE